MRHDNSDTIYNVTGSGEVAESWWLWEYRRRFRQRWWLPRHQSTERYATIVSVCEAWKSP